MADTAFGKALSDNGGMDPDQRPADAFGTLHLEHSSTVDRVAEELRRAVFEGELESGTPLREVALADSLGVSRPTLREALALLVAEGLATREPVRGALADYERAVAEGASYQELNQRHLAIHLSLVGLTGSPRLVAMAASIVAELRLALAQIDRVRRNARDQAGSHHHLLDLLESGDIEAAVAELDGPLGGAEDAIIERLDLD